MIDDFEAGRYVTLNRNPDYWGTRPALQRGQANLDEIRMEYFGDGSVMFEAFKAGELNSIRETNAEKWDSQYDFPAVQRGEVVKSDDPARAPLRHDRLRDEHPARRCSRTGACARR